MEWNRTAVGSSILTQLQKTVTETLASNFVVRQVVRVQTFDSPTKSFGRIFFSKICIFCKRAVATYFQLLCLCLRLPKLIWLNTCKKTYLKLEKNGREN
jgi:hypothetical protein